MVVALLKFRAVVVLPLPFKWSSGPSKGEGGGSRSNTATYRFKDERSSPSNICLNASKCTKDESGSGSSPSKDERGSSSKGCLLYTSPSPRDGQISRMPSSA